MGGTFTYNSTSRQYKPQIKSLLSIKNTPCTKRTRDDDTTPTMCLGCGRTGHSRPTCLFTTSKYFNKGSGKYIDSTAYASLLRDRPHHKDNTCPRDSIFKTALMRTYNRRFVNFVTTFEIFLAMSYYHNQLTYLPST